MRRGFSFLFVFLAFTLFAEQKIGYFDSEKIIAQSERAQELQKEFDKKVNEWKQELNKRRGEIEKLKKALENQSFMLTEEARARKIREIQEKQKSLEEFINEIYESGGKAELLNKKLMQPLHQDIDSVVTEIAKEDEFSLILYSKVVVFAEDAYDITDKVIERLNRKYAPEFAGEEVEYYVFKFKEDDTDSKSMGLGEKIKNLIFASIEGFGGSFEQIQTSDLKSAKASLAVEDEEEVSEDPDLLAVQFLNMTGIDFVVCGHVWVEAGNIFFEYSILDKDKEQAVKTEEVEVGVEENLQDKIAEEVIPEITTLYQ